MAYIDQAKKNELSPAIKAVCKKYGVKATIGIDHRTTLVLNIREGQIDFHAAYAGTPRECIQVNPYSIDQAWTGEARKFLAAVHAAMMTGNHDRSDMQSDYFDVGWFVEINIGSWEKPYRLAVVA